MRFADAALFCGWGRKEGGAAAQQMAARRGRPFRLLEDGFLRSYFPGNQEPSASYVVDDTGIYYDSRSPSKLETLIGSIPASGPLLERAQLAMAEIVSRRLSKYNNSPVRPFQDMGMASGKPFVLLIDQVAGDASISGAGATAASFEAMLTAAVATWPNHTIVVRAHPAADRVGHLEEAARRLGQGLILKQRANIWPLLEAADHICTVSSQVGFEALMAGKRVCCFGLPFYAGWGVTDDQLAQPRRVGSKTVAQIFAAAYLQYAQYLSLHNRKLTTLENTIDELTVLRDSRERNRYGVVTIGMSQWKRRAVSPFLVSPQGAPRHVARIADAKARLNTGDALNVAVWGPAVLAESLPPNWRLVRMEDGFLRSVGLGAALRMPMSLVREAGPHLYFDARGPGTIAGHVATAQNSPELLERAQRLRGMIRDRRVTKYMPTKRQLNASHGLPAVQAGRVKILVAGQVEADASVRFGAPGVNTNTGLIAAVRKIYPDAFIAYREHPDVAKGLRAGKADRSLADFNADEADINALFDWCDRIETMTSLSGFEALLRGKAVGVHGWPFYAGWGLTDDRLPRAPRGTASLDALVAASLILYPDYVHPVSGLPCSPEAVVEALSNPISPRLRDRLLYYPAGYALGRLKAVVRRT